MTFVEIAQPGANRTSPLAWCRAVSPKALDSEILVKGSAIALLVLTLHASAHAACVTERGLQFCAAPADQPALGQPIVLTVSIRNIGKSPVSLIDLEKVPAAIRSGFVTVWDTTKTKCSLLPLPAARPEYAAQLRPGSSRTVTVETNCTAKLGRNELLVALPYFWPRSPEFTDAEIKRFYRAAWKAPKVAPLIGPIVFETR
jgi:hypothetical protein